MRRLLFAVAVCTLLVCPAGSSVEASGSNYTIKTLGTVAGIAPHVTGVNASGAVSGWYTNASGADRAVRYSDDTGWTPIPGLESLTSYALGINDRGDIVGYAFLATGELRAYRYSDAGGLEFVAPLDGGTFTIAMGISNTGEITGYGNTSTTTTAFRQTPHLLAQAVTALGGAFSGGCAINDNGQIAGSALTPMGVEHGFLANLDGTVADIAAIDGALGTSLACAIDSDGSVTGQSEAASGVMHAFLFKGNNVSDLDSFGSTGSNGLAISGGVVVGNYTLADNTTMHAFEYSTTTGTIDLNTLVTPGSGWVLTSATGVNSKGVVVGQATLNGSDTAFMLTPAADTTAPTITSISVTPSVIKPNNHMTPVTVSVTAVDNVDPQPTCSITSIDATEADPSDASITGALTASLLAVKDSRGQSRTYALTVTCGDASQNLSTAEVDVLISTSKGGAVSKPVHVTGAAWKGKK